MDRQDINTYAQPAVRLGDGQIRRDLADNPHSPRAADERPERQPDSEEGCDAGYDAHGETGNRAISGRLSRSTRLLGLKEISNQHYENYRSKYSPEVINAFC